MKASEFYNKPTKIAYHATPKRKLPNVLFKGLIPSRSKNWPGERVYLFPSKKAADIALNNWLGDRFKGELLSLLAVNTNGLKVFEDFDELFTTDTISPDRLSIVEKEWG